MHAGKRVIGYARKAVNSLRHADLQEKSAVTGRTLAWDWGTSSSVIDWRCRAGESIARRLCSDGWARNGAAG